MTAIRHDQWGCIAAVLACSLLGVGCVGWRPPTGPVTASDREVRVTLSPVETVTFGGTDSTWRETAMTALYGRVAGVVADTVDLLVTRVDGRGGTRLLPSGSRSRIVMTRRHRVDVQRAPEHLGRNIAIGSAVALLALTIVTILAVRSLHLGI